MPALRVVLLVVKVIELDFNLVFLREAGLHQLLAFICTDACISLFSWRGVVRAGCDSLFIMIAFNSPVI